MIDSKVVESIRALSAEDKEGFDQFLLSPFFQKGFSVDELRAFFHFILAGLGKPDTTSFSKENAYELLYPAKAFNQSRMDRIMFELNRLVQVFLQIKTYLKKENEVQRLLDWSEFQRKSGSPFPYEKQLQKTLEETEYLDLSLTEGFFKSYQIAKEYHEWLSLFNRVKGDLGIPRVVYYLDLYYYTQKLELLNRYQLQQKATLITPSVTIQRDLFTFKIPEHYTQEHPELTILEKIHELFQPEVPSPNGFRELMDMLAVLENRLTAEELYQVYAYLRSYCTILIDAGFSEFNVILHEIHRDNLLRGYFYHEGKMPASAFLNITQHALRAQNHAWALHFIESHKDLILGENETRDFYKMNLALYYFAEKKYEEALQIIPFSSANIYYHLMARRLELKIFYELRSDILPSKIDAFKMFVSRAGNKTFSKHLSELLTNFGNFVHQLSLSIPGDKKRSEQLLKRIESKKLVGERGWLMEKALEIGLPKSSRN